MTEPRWRTSMLLLAALVCALVSLACVAVPLYVIWPFRHQGVTELGIALFVVRIAPWLSLLAAAACLVLVTFTWRGARGWMRRTAAIFVLLLAVSGALLSRVNIYEKMFHPLGAPQFESADQAKLAGDDMVIAIRMGDTRRAYPIREMAYHHVVNDVAGREPVVATY